MGPSNSAPRRPPGPGGATPSRPGATEVDAADLVVQLGIEVAAALSSALERVNTLATTGRIDRESLRALREEIEQARRVGMMGQQVIRFASGEVQLTLERLDLSAMLREALQLRVRETEARGIEVRQLLRPAEVTGDPALTFALLETLLDWSFDHACSRVDLSIEHKSWPANALLGCSFAHRPADEAGEADAQTRATVAQALDTISWRLLQQTAATLGLSVEREDDASRTKVTIELPLAAGARSPGLQTIDLDGGPGTAGGRGRPLAGSHVLVVAARREVRAQVRDSVRTLGLMIDFVTSVDEAREFCRGGMPHVIVYEAVLGGELFERFRRDMLTEVPTLSFVQITEDGRDFEVRSVGDRQLTSVGRAAIVESLPSALSFELTRGS
jgi:hypothetical protein